MIARKTLTGEAGKALAAGLMAAWLSTGALADDGGANPANDAGVHVSVPEVQVVNLMDFRDAPDTRTILALVGGETDKHNAMMLVYSGNDEKIIHMLQVGASVARSKGKRVMGVALIGESEDIGAGEIAVISNGLLTENRNPSDPGVDDRTIYQYLVDTQELFLVPSVRREREREQQGPELSQL